MEYAKAFKIIKELKYDIPKVIYSRNGISIYVVRPRGKFKEYDAKKNFQIFLEEGERKFKPNHLRIMIDLHLRVRSRPDLKRQLLKAFDNVFYKKDPLKAISRLKKEKFAHSLNQIEISAVLSQLFIIEQEYNYHKESNYDPATLFYQGWIRQFLDSTKEVDNLCMSVCKGQPPMAKYTSFENKKSKKYNKKNVTLWYLND